MKSPSAQSLKMLLLTLCLCYWSVEIIVAFVEHIPCIMSLSIIITLFYR